MNPWAELGLAPRLVISDDEVEAAFREVSTGSHPDAGGRLGEFERLREARDLLRDEFRRLEAWLGFYGVELTHSGAVSEEVGAMFLRVNEVTAGMDEWQKRGEEVSSGLGRALWQKEGFVWKERLEVLLGEVTSWQEGVLGRFSEAEEDGGGGDFSKGLALREELGFLRKWRAELQRRFGPLWEALV